jgi:hypothetical protein
MDKVDHWKTFIIRQPAYVFQRGIDKKRFSGTSTFPGGQAGPRRLDHGVSTPAMP